MAQDISVRSLLAALGISFLFSLLLVLDLTVIYFPGHPYFTETDEFSYFRAFSSFLRSGFLIFVPVTFLIFTSRRAAVVSVAVSASVGVFLGYWEAVDPNTHMMRDSYAMLLHIFVYSIGMSLVVLFVPAVVYWLVRLFRFKKHAK